MDVVITYVDGNDPLWQRDYREFAGGTALVKRFRDWGTLKYLLRGIESNMPFIRNVYLVVSRQSQVPSWADTDELKIVLHEDIIPERYLPTFNSTSIEMFLHRIDGLDEEYLYFNDDMFPVSECAPEDFFRGGRGVIGMSTHLLSSGMYKKQCRNSDRLARRASGVKPTPFFVRPQHICSPMLKSECESVFAKGETEILSSVSRLRTNDNYNQYLFLDYMYHNGRLIPEKISNKHFSVAVAGAEKIASFIRKPSRKMCCINDVHLSDEKFMSMREIILAAFDEVLPNKSRFEK